ncbi:MAG: PAS domain S-box protein [Candidatus Aminicenantes bacterium]
MTEKKKMPLNSSPESIRLYGLLESAPDMIFISKEKPQFIEVNQAACEKLGYSKQELQNMPIKNIIAPAYRDEMEKLQKQIRKKGTAFLEMDFLTKKEQRLRVEIHLKKIQFKDHFEVIAIGRDITEKHEYQNKLKQAQDRYRAVFKKSLDWVYIHDFKGNFIDANPAALEGMGYTKEEISSLNFTKLLEKKQLPKTLKTLWELRKTGTQSELTEYKIRRRDGGFVWAETKASVIYKDGKPSAVLGIARDITDRKEAEKKLHETEERYKAVFDRSLDWIFIHDWDNNILDANQPALDGLGYSREEIKSYRLDDILREDQLSKAEKIQKELKKYGRQKEQEEFVILKKNGEELYVEVLTSVLCRDGDPYAIQGVGRDITARKRVEQALQESEKKHRIIFESSPTAIWYEDAAEVKDLLDNLASQGVKDIRAHLDKHPGLVKKAAKKIKVSDINPAALDLWEAEDKKELLSLEKKFTKEEFKTFKNELCAFAEGRSFFEEETVGKTLKGNTIHYIIRIALAPGINFKNVLVNEMDITRRKKTEEALEDANEELKVQARTDSLTGLLNHGAIMDRLREELSRGSREKKPVAFIIADLDHFKRVNDEYGHTVGDDILSSTARRIRSACRKYDVVGRYGGEEFAVVLPGTGLEEAGNVAERIRKDVEKKPHLSDGKKIDMTLSLGVSAVSKPKSEKDSESLVKKADNALYEAKEKGRNRVVIPGD